MDPACPPDVARLADTLSLLHLQMHTLAGMATDEQRERLERLLEGAGHG